MYKQVLFFWISIFIIFLWQFFLENPIFNRIFFNYSENHISNFLDLDEKILIEWRICWEVDKRIFKTNYVVCVKNISILEKDREKFFSEKKWISKYEKFIESKKISDVQKKFFTWEKIFSEWKILISASLYPEYDFWDNLRIFWKLKTPFEEKDFSYKNFLLKEWIFWVIYYWKVERIGFKGDDFNFLEKQKFLLFQKIFQFKKNFLEKIEKIYPSPHSAFLAWLLIGDRKWLPDDVKEDFQKNWLAHIVAISWYNITMIIILISWIFFFLPRRMWIIISVIVIILFTIFVWWTSAVVRASVMWILWLLALYYWREKNILILIMATIFWMSLRNPMLLWWDIWFHLSILAVIWIVYLVKIFEKFTKNINNIFWIKEIILMTISASLMTFPLISYHFWIVSLISPIANLLVAPLTPLAMLFWFLSIISSYFENIWIFYFFQEFFGFLTYSILDLALKLSHYFANIEYAFIEYKISIFWVIFYFMVLWVVFWIFREDFE